jgi:arylsulfatase A
VKQRAPERKPFSLYLAYSAPHRPILPTKEWQGKIGLSVYADFVKQTAAAVGELLAVLQRLALATNTLVICTSDNGCSPSAGFGELKARGHNRSGPGSDRLPRRMTCGCGWPVKPSAIAMF